jgi:hypothetical protein
MLVLLGFGYSRAVETYGGLQKNQWEVQATKQKKQPQSLFLDN